MKHRDKIEEALADIIDAYIDDEGNVIEQPAAKAPQSHILVLTEDEATILGLSSIYVAKDGAVFGFAE